MSHELLKTLISALIGGTASVLVAVLQARMTRRWNQEDKRASAPETKETR